MWIASHVWSIYKANQQKFGKRREVTTMNQKVPHQKENKNESKDPRSIILSKYTFSSKTYNPFLRSPKKKIVIPLNR